MKRRHKASASTMEERERKREVIRFLIDFRAAQEEYMKMNPIRYKKMKTTRKKSNMQMLP